MTHEAGAEMTNDEIDIAVGTKVMGWQRVLAPDEFGMTEWIWLYEKPTITLEPGGVNCAGPGHWNPSEDIEDAWEVVEHLARQKVYLDIIQVDDGWMVGHDSSGYTDDDGTVDLHLNHVGLAKTAPLAICLAALATCKGKA